MGFVCSAAIVYRWSRYLIRHPPFSKHHFWMLSRALATSAINERGKGLHREYRKTESPKIEVRHTINNEVSLV